MRQILNKYITGILVFYTFWLWGLPLVFSKAVPVVCENLSYNSNYEIKTEEPRLRLNLLPTAKISANHIEITDKKTKDNIVLETPALKIRILPLLSGMVHINKIEVANIEIDSYLDNKPELDKDFFSKLSNAKVKCDSVKIDKFKLSITQKDVKTPILYSGKDVFCKKNNRYIKLHTDSSVNIQGAVSEAKIDLFLPGNNDINKSVIDIKISNFNLEPLGNYLKHYLPQDLKDVKGIINVDVDKNNLHAVFENCAILMKDSGKSIIFPDVLNVNSTFALTSKKINFETIDVDSKNIHASVNGYVLNYLDKPLTAINLNVQLNKSRVEDIVNLLPPIVVEEFNVYKLKTYKFYGDAIGNFSIRGNTLEPDIVGDVYIDNGILIKPIKNAKGATVKLDFTGRYVNYDVVVPAGGAEKVWVKGGVELYNVKYADMRVWSTKNVDLELAEEKVLPIHEILNFIIGPVPIMDIKGDGNIDITIKGNRKNPHVWGNANFNNVKTYFNDMPDLVLTNADAVLQFNDQSATFTSKRGKVNGRDISINGTCNLFGKFDFDVVSKNQPLDYLFRAIQTSTMIDDLKKMLPNLDVCEGLVNLNLKVYGAIKDIEYIKFNENFFTGGEITLLGNTFGMQGVKVNNTKGKISVNGTNADVDVNSFIGKSPITVKAIVKNNIADLNLSIPKLNLNDVTPSTNDLQNDIGNILLAVNAKYKGAVDKIEYNKISFNAKILGTEAGNKLKIPNGEITLADNKLKIENVSGFIEGSPSTFDVNLRADNVSTKPDVNGQIKLKYFDLPLLNSFAQYSIIPPEIKEYIKLVKFDKGRINLNCRIAHNKLNAYTDLGGMAFIYTPLELPVQIVNGSLIMRNGTLRLNKINLLADGMPILADGEINDVFTKQNFNIYVNSKPKQEFIDKYVNKNQIYPIKIKGDIVYSSRFKGVKDNFDAKSEINMSKDSSIYYLGATIGDIENAIVLNLETKVLKQYMMKIKEFSYDKLISSQSNRQTRLNMLKARGGIDVYKDDLEFHNLYIKTQNPTDARIFNIIFRKPNIKQGQFTSDLMFNGKLSNPRLLGDFHIFETNIPFLDTTMKNIVFVFKDKTIDLTSKGEILGNDIAVQAVLKNKLVPPYHIEKANLYTKVLDLNYITNKLKLSQVENLHTFETFEGLDLTSLVIKNLKMNADSIHLRNIVAEDFEAQGSLSEKNLVNIERFKFNMASGRLNGDFKFNLKNNHTELNLKAAGIDANDLSIALFDLNNQIYGDLTGDIKLSCDGTDFEKCMKTLNGKTTFNVAEGRMPKLGSLEYLLKAGNLIKGGFTGISINSVIDIITPLKTGNFSNIYGTADIKDGVAENIGIASRGKDLSLFISGNYNFSTSIAEMEVFGLLSKKISTMFGPVGNLSLNTLFNVIPGVDLSKDNRVLEHINKIPGIELSSKAYRKFIAEIKGNINGEDYVTSFKWIN